MSQRNVDDDEYEDLLRQEIAYLRESHGKALLQIDRMRPVVEAATEWRDPYYDTGGEFDDEREEQAFVERLGEIQSRLWEAVEAVEAAEKEN